MLHPTSLASPHGIGDLGAEARRFVDFLADAGQKLWQVLPLGPTGYGDSPYQCFSAWAGNPLLISLERLVEQGSLDASALENAPQFPEDRVEFERLIPWKTALLEAARYGRGFETFCEANRHWLDDFALFVALKARHQGAAWTKWEPGARDRDPKAISKWRDQLAGQIDSQKLLQFVFFEQWRELREYARARGVRIMGDLPIYVAHDSADVWANRQYFRLDQQGNPTVVSGVPPDYFSKTGQLWGNPIYRWDVLAADGYRWWLDRFRATFEMVDMIRLDHFRGFEAYWEIPASEPTAVNGRWVKGPGAELFREAKAKLGELTVGCGEPWRDHSGSGGDSGGVRISGHGGAAVCLRNRSSGAHVSPAQLSTGGGGVHGDARQRYDGRVVEEQRLGRQHADGRGHPARARFCDAVPQQRRLGDSVDFYSRAGGFGGQHGDSSFAGRAGIGDRGAHESARDVGRKLAVEISSGCVEAEFARRMRELTKLYDR